ncbi:trimethylamine methyltransferase family protein [Aliamphritea spongicola]|uniref:trimethylamine methyltransferase family protein n=1 Tax=Aliamphritea spongicola TaxID=707589 RepID=UPI00196B8EE3|nr:trimethylamine methyltransferase family protein [Aliamphritea spongicola]MBN3562884.1 trimethylamine methyltransferase family protein [Aliamphritea spongicola]
MLHSENGKQTGRPSRRNRRPGRITQRGNPQPKVHLIERKTPLYNLLDDAALDALEDQADWILEDIGIVFKNDEEALALFAAAGAMVDGDRVRFPRGLARALCQTAPHTFNLYGRKPDYVVPVGGDSVVLTPAYGSPFVTDLDNGRRYATLSDFENFVKLAQLTLWLQHSGGTVCEPVNIPVNKRHLDMTYAHLRYSEKPFMGAVTSAERAEDSIAMARLVYGQDYMDKHCVIQGNINVNSPLVFDDVMTGSLKAYARANQGIVLSPFILGGAMGPVTQPALIAQAHAEAMVGIALGQLIRPGSPVVYGNFLTTMNLKSGAPTFGTPEANLSALAIGQLCRRLGLPLRCGGHLTASKVADGQAMQESSDSMNAGLLAGGNYILHAAGWLEGGLTMGYEKFVMDLDRCGMIHTQLAGLTIDANSLGTQAYLQAGPGENFLATEHTMANFRDANYLSDLADTNSFEQWQEGGCLTLEQRANARWKTMLADYRPPEFDAVKDRELQAFIEDRKASMPDQWY